MGLAKKVCRRKPASQQGSHQDPGQPDLPDDVHLGGISLPMKQDPDNLPNRNRHASDVDVQYRNHAKGSQQREKHDPVLGPPAVGMKVFFFHNRSYFS